MFFPCLQDNKEELVEIGEARILKFSLSDEDVSNLNNDYTQSTGTDGIKKFLEHQLGTGNSWGSWKALYDSYFVESVVEIPTKIIEHPVTPEISAVIDKWAVYDAMDV